MTFSANADLQKLHGDSNKQEIALFSKPKNF